MYLILIWLTVSLREERSFLAAFDVYEDVSSNYGIGDLVLARWTRLVSAIIAVSAGLLIFSYFYTSLPSRPDIRMTITSNITMFDQEYWIAEHMAGEGPTDRWRSGISVDLNLVLRNRKNEVTSVRIDYGIVNKSSGKKVSGGVRSMALWAKESKNEDIVYSFVTSTTPGVLPNPEDYSFRLVLVGQSVWGDTWRREFFPPVPGVGNFKA